MRIDSAGNATFAGDLTVAGGDITLGGTGRIQGVDTVSASTDAANKAYVDAQVGSADTLQEVTNNGSTTTNTMITTSRIGIGTTTNPPHRLVVTDGASPYSSSNILLQVKRNSSNGNDDTSRSAIMLANNSNAFTIAYGGTTDRLRFIDGGNSEALTILNGGKVGIGTASPNSKLQVKSSGSNIDEITLVHSGNTVKIAALGQESSHGSLYLRHNNGVAKVRLSAGGNNSYILDSNVGIGTTSPGARLHVSEAGTANTQTIVAGLSSTSLRPVLQFSENANATINSGMSIEYDGRGTGTANKMHINGVDGAAKFTVTSGGSVGIGTTSPSEKLTVEGNIETGNGWLYLRRYHNA